VPTESNVTLKLYDLLGREMRTLVEGTVAAGRYRIGVDAFGLASGV
jgi:hypothetical protein